MRILLNVGGTYFETYTGTLKQFPYFDSLMRNTKGDEIFIDRDPTFFRHILNWMRGSEFLPHDKDALCELVYECDYYCLEQMKHQVEGALQRFFPVLI